MKSIKVSEIVHVNSFFRKLLLVDHDFSLALKIAEYYKEIEKKMEVLEAVETPLMNKMRVAKSQEEYGELKKKHDEFLSTETEINVFEISRELLNKVKCKPLEAQVLNAFGFIKSEEKESPNTT